MAANKIVKLSMDLRYQFSLKLENIEILSILLAAIFKIKMTLNAIFIITNQFHTHHFQNGCQQNRQIVNGLRFQ
jgi:hypothetical protein